MTAVGDPLENSKGCARSGSEQGWTSASWTYLEAVSRERASVQVEQARAEAGPGRRGRGTRPHPAP